MELTNQNLMKLYCCSENTAKQRKNEILESFNLPTKNRRPLLIHFAIYNRISIDTARTMLLE